MLLVCLNRLAVQRGRSNGWYNKEKARSSQLKLNTANHMDSGLAASHIPYTMLNEREMRMKGNGSSFVMQLYLHYDSLLRDCRRHSNKRIKSAHKKTNRHLNQFVQRIQRHKILISI